MPPENNPPAPSPNLATQFLTEEYKALREEIKSLVAENQTMERFAGGAVAAVITWLLTTKGITNWAFILASFVPLLITAIVALRCYGIGLRLRQIGSYIRTYEAWLMQNLPDQSTSHPTGWETKFHEITENAQPQRTPKSFFESLKHKVHQSPFYLTAKIYWILLLVFSLIFCGVSIIGKLSTTTTTQRNTVTVSDPSGSSSTVTVPLGITIEVKRPAS